MGNSDNVIRIGNQDASRAATWVYGSFPVCIKDVVDAPVQLDRVELRDTDGMGLVRAGVRTLHRGDEAVAAWPGPMPDGFETVDHLDFDVVCGDPDTSAEVALEVRRTGSGSGQMSAFVVIYDTPAGQRSLTYDAQIALCVDNAYELCEN